MATHGARGRSGGRPTLEEVAARAGVGRGTVSRVINGSPRVSDATRAAVEAAVAELGYVPNTAARALAANRTDAIALVVPEPETRFFAEPYFSDMLKGVGSALSDTEMQLLLIFAGSDRERARLAQYLAAHRVDGVLLVDSDNYGGARQAVEHLLSRGRSRVAHITGRLDVYGAQRRVDGYRAAMSDAGLGVDEGMIEAGDFTEEGGHAAMAALLERHPDIDAVFAASDVTAAGARRALREAGRRIPEDVALVGYDDSAIARHMEPPLTSVRQPIEEMGRRMIDLLLTEVADRRPLASRGLERRQMVLATELVSRSSS